MRRPSFPLGLSTSRRRVVRRHGQRAPGACQVEGGPAWGQPALQACKLASMWPTVRALLVERGASEREGLSCPSSCLVTAGYESLAAAELVESPLAVGRPRAAGRGGLPLTRCNKAIPGWPGPGYAGLRPIARRDSPRRAPEAPTDGGHSGLYWTAGPRKDVSRRTRCCCCGGGGTAGTRALVLPQGVGG